MKITLYSSESDCVSVLHTNNHLLNYSMAQGLKQPLTVIHLVKKLSSSRNQKLEHHINTRLTLKPILCTVKP